MQATMAAALPSTVSEAVQNELTLACATYRSAGIRDQFPGPVLHGIGQVTRPPSHGIQSGTLLAQFVDGRAHGFADGHWESGVSFVGVCKNGLWSHGHLKLASGVEYIGNFAPDAQSGDFTVSLLKSTDGSMSDVHFQDGVLRVGEGVPAQQCDSYRAAWDRQLDRLNAKCVALKAAFAVVLAQIDSDSKASAAVSK